MSDAPFLVEVLKRVVFVSSPTSIRFSTMNIRSSGHGNTNHPTVSLTENGRRINNTTTSHVLLSMEAADATTSSTHHGVSLSTERIHRLHGTSLIASACDLLKLGASTYATACTLFHRFFVRASLTTFDVWSVAMACTLLASKVEEEPCPVRSIIVIYAHLYRKRRLNQEEKDNTTVSTTTAMSIAKRQELRQVQPMSNMSPVWHEWHKALIDTEHHILRHLGFVLYWIPGSHPHKFILYFCRALDLDMIPDLAQRAWNYCNDSCRLDLCVRFEPELIACASIYLAACYDFKMSLPLNPRPWWQIFCGPDKSQALSAIANAILGLLDTNYNEDIDLAYRHFVPSLIPCGSFNDPDSFIGTQVQS